jgi:hypothetical protein
MAKLSGKEIQKLAGLSGVKTQERFSYSALVEKISQQTPGCGPAEFLRGNQFLCFRNPTSAPA